MSYLFPTIFTPRDLPSIGIWYLATPYYKYPHGRKAAYVNAAKISAWLVNHKVPHHRPIVASHPVAEYGGIDPLSHEIWMADNAPFIEVSKGLCIAKMDGWKDSYGIGLEISAFVEADKPVYLLSLDDHPIQEGA